VLFFVCCQGQRGSDDVIVRSRDLRDRSLHQRHRWSPAVNFRLLTFLLPLLLMMMIMKMLWLKLIAISLFS